MTDDEARKEFGTLHEMAVAWQRPDADLFHHALQAIEDREALVIAVKAYFSGQITADGLLATLKACDPTSRKV